MDIMKHFISFLTALAAVGFSQAATVPYSSELCEDDAWTVVDANDDGTTWNDLYDNYYIEESGFDYGKYYKYSRQNDADDWLISPAIMLEGGKTYTVSFWSCARDEWEGFSLSMAATNSTADLSAASAVLYTYPTGDYNNASTDCRKVVCTVTPAASGNYYFGFHATSEADGQGIYLTGFDVREFEFTPAPVSDLRAVAAEDGSIVCDVTWTLPSADIYGQPFPAGVTISKVELYRDGSLLRTLAADAVSFTDEEAYGLTTGFHTYKVLAYVGDRLSQAETHSGYIGTIPAAVIPWNVDASQISADDFEAFWNVVKGEDSTIPAEYGWQLKPSYIRFDPRSKNYDEDDWLVLPCMNFTTPGIYRLRLNAQCSASGALLDAHIGSGRVPSSADRKIGSFDTFPSEDDDVWITFRVAQAGEYYLSLHACRPEIESTKPIDIYSLAVETWKESPLNITGLTAETTESSATLTWTNPSLNNIGEQIESLAKIEIKRDGALIATLTDNLTAGAAMSYTDTPERGGIFTYTVVPFLSDNTAPESAPASVSTGWIGDKTRVLPYVVDFSQAPSVLELNTLWTVEDTDSDDYSWVISANSFTLQLNADGGTSDDVLLTPPFRVTENQLYKLTIAANGAQEEFPLVVTLRTDAESEAKTILLSGSESYEEYTAELAAPVSGIAQIAVSSLPEFEYTFDLEPVRINLLKIEDTGVNTGIDDIDASVSIDVQVRYYDLTGIPVSHPEKGRIYIRIDSTGKVSKFCF